MRPLPGGHFGPTELRLAMAAPRPAAGLTSEWRLVDGLRTRLVPDASLVVVPGVAHNVVTTAPAQVADACRRLLAPQPALSDR
ncbi:hypothetical protein ACLQ29_18945 [Micromonospora sp. DT228]|uniref:hypothetical protein n=1 Tax=Micromonospora sp. DT228 TaxID=3393443 RepID=UPI003CE7C573